MIFSKNPILKTTVLGYETEVFVLSSSKRKFLIFNVVGTKDTCTAVSCAETLVHKEDLPTFEAAFVVSSDVFGAYIHEGDGEAEMVDNIETAITERVFTFMTKVNKRPKAVKNVRENVHYL